MTSALRWKRDQAGRLCLRTRASRRLGYGLAALLLCGALALGLDPARDFAPPRLAGTILYAMILAAVAGAALRDRVVWVEREGLRETRRIAGLVVRREMRSVASDAVVRLRERKRPRYALEIDRAGEVAVLDVSSWKSDLEPMGREIARELGLRYEGLTSGS